MIDAKTLRELLSYDPETGIFTWRVDRRHLKPGRWPGTPHKDGYRMIKIDKRLYLSHRLAFFYVHGRWPQNKIDHKDGNRLNNRIDNLREATDTQNAINSKLRSDNKLGFRGVCFHIRLGKYAASISVARKRSSLGYFNTAEKAHRAYLKAARELHGEFVRTA